MECHEQQASFARGCSWKLRLEPDASHPNQRELLLLQQLPTDMTRVRIASLCADSAFR